MKFLKDHAQTIHGWLVVFWFLMIIPTIVLKWYNILAYVAALSLYANLVGHWSGWSAERTNEDSD
jgi:hypothetical protein